MPNTNSDTPKPAIDIRADWDGFDADTKYWFYITAISAFTRVLSAVPDAILDHMIASLSMTLMLADLLAKTPEDKGHSDELLMAATAVAAERKRRLVQRSAPTAPAAETTDPLEAMFAAGTAEGRDA